MTGGRRRKPAVAIRRARALKMRQAGASYADIATALDLPTEKHARTDVSRAMREVVREAGEELVALERDRYDRLQAMAWRLAAAGDVRAMRECVRIFERRAKLLGLDARGPSDTDDVDSARSLVGELHARLTVAYEAGELEG
jgi:hypothetical protein